jgi:hypothetical protein
MPTDCNEFVMMAAHCLLVGFEVGAMRVMENKACCDDVAAKAGSGKAEKTSTNVTAARSAPLAEPFTVEFIFDTKLALTVSKHSCAETAGCW